MGIEPPTTEELMMRLCVELDWALKIIIDLDGEGPNENRARLGLAVVQILMDRLKVN